jgi:2-keto-4-pentenoate hydratase/2-oxohepta-3-ene-1,7-dioic acid hydratase in catechol pathway
MRWVTFADARGERLGALDDSGRVRDVTAADPSLPRDMLGLIASGRRVDAGLVEAAPVVADAALRPPVPRPPKNVFCVGKNYHEHAKEFAGSGFDGGAKDVVPPYPVVFTKPHTSLAAPGAPILSALDPTGGLDYEGELVVVIGTGGRGIAAEAALGHVFGYTIANDVTARHLQKRHSQWVLGKGLDGFCPMGPAILTADAVPDPRALTLSTFVNGARRQHAPVADLIFDIPTLIAAISAGITLEPGDLIATGTPAGVGIGFDPPVFLKPGDVVRIEVPGIGALENTVS